MPFDVDKLIAKAIECKALEENELRELCRKVSFARLFA